MAVRVRAEARSHLGAWLGEEELVGRLDGKVVLITGGARGQGAAEARLFHDEGARIVIGDVLDSDGELVAKDIGDSALYIHHDVTSEESWSAFVNASKDRFSGVDVLINNAGIFRINPIAMTTLEEYTSVITINQVGVFLGIKAMVPVMADAGGSIINISSVAGLRGSAATISYTASKFAVRGMTKVAALELAPFGIRVNSIHPGLIDTPMLQEFARLGGDDAIERAGAAVPLGRLAGALDVARLALFLASDESAYCTGAEFVVDGGLTAGMTARQPEASDQ